VQLEPGSYQSEQTHPNLPVVQRLPWIHLPTLTTLSQYVILADCQGRKDVSWRHRHPLIWQDFFPALQCTLYIGQWTFEEINLIDQCYLLFMKYWNCWKLLFLCESPESHLLQSIYYSSNIATLCVWVCVSTCGCIIFFVQMSAKYSVQKNACPECLLEVNNFGYCPKCLFHRANVVNFWRRKYLSFIE
jgi:hypothetical protein